MHQIVYQGFIHPINNHRPLYYLVYHIIASLYIEQTQFSFNLLIDSALRINDHQLFHKSAIGLIVAFLPD